MAVLAALDRRDRVPELMDWPGLDPAEHRAALTALARINRLSLSAEILWPPIRELSSSDLGLRDARLVTKTPPGGPEGTTRNLRADYVFVDSSAEVERYAVLTPDDPAAPPSDHNVTGWFRWSSSTASLLSRSSSSAGTRLWSTTTSQPRRFCA